MKFSYKTTKHNLYIGFLYNLEQPKGMTLLLAERQVGTFIVRRLFPTYTSEGVVANKQAYFDQFQVSLICAWKIIWGPRRRSLPPLSREKVFSKRQV